MVERAVSLVSSSVYYQQKQSQVGLENRLLVRAHSSLPGVTARKSDALTTYDAGPMPDPCAILAVMSSTEDTTPW